MRIELISLVWKTSIIAIIRESHWRTAQESNLPNSGCSRTHKRSVNGPLVATTWLEQVTTSLWEMLSTNWNMLPFGGATRTRILILRLKVASNNHLYYSSVMVDTPRIELGPSVLQTDVRTSYTRYPLVENVSFELTWISRCKRDDHPKQSHSPRNL